MKHAPELNVYRDPATLPTAAAERFIQAAIAAQDARGMFNVALSGGSTPRGMYRALAAPPYRDQVNWNAVQVFFSDERFVPPESEESNYHLARQELLSQVQIPDRFVHRVATVDILPAESAALYEQGIRRVLQAGLDEVPSFDLIFLGLGPDGHTASLFPGTEALQERDLLVAANFVPELDSWRITFTYPLLNAARQVAFLVEGAGKAEMVRRVIEGDAELPASLIRPITGELVWMLDQAAAADLPGQG